MISIPLIDELATTTSVDAQVKRLGDAGFLHSEGVVSLLDAAEERVGVHPEQTQALARLAFEVAQRLQRPDLAARASYLQGHVYAIQADFPHALEMVDAAYAAYTAHGLTLEAQRTVVGRMRILGEMGQFEAALQVGQTTLATLPELNAQSPSAERLLAGHLHQSSGLCYELSGRYEQALASYDVAEAHYRVLSATEQMADIALNRGLTLLYLGRVSEALNAFDAAAQTYAQANQPLFQARALINRGEALLLLSDYMQSLRAFEEAQQLLAQEGVDEADQLADYPILLRQMGDLYLALNLYSEALDAYRLAEPALAERALAHHHALCLWGMGVAYQGQRRWAEARQRLEDAAARFHLIGDTPRQIDVELELAAHLARQGEADRALALVQQAQVMTAGTNWVLQQVNTAMRLVDLVLTNDPPDLTAAAATLLAIQSQVSQLNLPHLRYRLEQRLGRLARLAGNEEEAQLHLEQAIRSIEQIRATLLQERMRASFLDDKLAAYQELVALHLDRYQRAGDGVHLQAAFAVAEQAKSRVLADMVAGVITPQRDDALDSESLAQLQALQKELDAIYASSHPAQNTNAEPDPSSESDTRRPRGAVIPARDVAHIEHEISRLRMQRMVMRLPVPDPLMPFRTDPARALPAVPTDLVLIVYYQIGEELLAFVQMGTQQIHVVRHLGRVDEIQQLLIWLNAQWQRFRVDRSFVEQHMPAFEQSTQRILARLYEHLLAPVLTLVEMHQSAALDAARPHKLVIVPHGILHQIPFHALHDGKRFVLERYAVSYAPSMTVFTLCRQRHLHIGGKALVVGIADERIPAAQGEVEDVSMQLRQYGVAVQTLLNAEADRARFLDLADQCHVVHLACHGLFRSDNPMFSSLQLSNGRFTAAEAAQLSLCNALVTLSACESGRSSVLGSDEPLGLSYAFLSAGAVTLLVSQWLAQDASTALLMQRWYSQLAGEEGPVDLAEALRQAQLAVKERYPHPYYWAPFMLIGQRERM